MYSELLPDNAYESTLELVSRDSGQWTMNTAVIIRENIVKQEQCGWCSTEVQGDCVDIY